MILQAVLSLISLLWTYLFTQNLKKPEGLQNTTTRPYEGPYHTNKGNFEAGEQARILQESKPETERRKGEQEPESRILTKHFYTFMPKAEM